MTYDLELADRLRERLASEADVTERRMFGGLAFLVAGHLAVSASGQGGLLVRCDASDQEALERDPRVGPFVMRGRPMTGWVHADVDGSVDDADLDGWLDHGLAFARSLPPR
ncbi:TfoX N-terminal domain-containing protein [Friedmanniella luteola]|uniref:TfoX N-terminal domain-containing protein n=1 Tax=Friedmanniella luteola TaxID=546871 RepID=A0A1H1ZJY3_9ACTN|nr:TfoX/Sxy family protein [Friedmanniella luteola]SDT33963.1 TfoX N-terminal domain-containing protein [Friedmanniella luteola]